MAIKETNNASAGDSAFFRTRMGDAILLLVLLLSIGVRARPEFQLDEDRFVQYADNLTRGFYADPVSKFIWNGPGYPLLLAPFRYLGISLLWAKFLNAFFLLGALIYIRKTLRLYLPGRRAGQLAYVGFAYLALFGLPWLHLLMTEPMSVFCVAGLLFHFCASGGSDSRPGRHVLWAAVFGAALTLTKFFFGYVFLAGCFLGLAGLALRSRSCLRGTQVSALVLIFCLPYLGYTYHITNRIFYWGNTGGEQLYSLTLPEKNLLGDVVPMNWVAQYPDLFPSEIGLVDSVAMLDQVQRDQAFRHAAIQNILHHPAKVFRNWRANVNRLVFDYPFSHFPGSHSQERTGNLGFLFAPIWLAVFLCLIPTLWKPRAFAPEFLGMLGFAWISLGGLSLVSAYARFTFPLLPILLCWVILTATKIVEIRLRID